NPVRVADSPASCGLPWGYISLNRAAEAHQAVRTALPGVPDVPEGAVDRYHIAFLQADSSGMERQSALAKGKPTLEDWIAHLQGLTLAQAGRLATARESARRAIEFASAAGRRERAAEYETAAAVWEAWYGNAAAAKRRATQVLDVSKGRHVTYAAALALAIAADHL